MAKKILSNTNTPVLHSQIQIPPRPGKLNNRKVIQQSSDRNNSSNDHISAANHAFHLALPFLILLAANADFKSLGLTIGKYGIDQMITYAPGLINYALQKTAQAVPAVAKFVIHHAPAVLDHAVKHPFKTASMLYGAYLPMKTVLKIPGLFGLTLPGSAISAKTAVYSGLALTALGNGGALLADQLAPKICRAIAYPGDIADSLISAGVSVLFQTGVSFIGDGSDSSSALVLAQPSFELPSLSAMSSAIALMSFASYKFLQFTKAAAPFFR